MHQCCLLKIFRSAFIARIANYRPDQLIFLDESAKDERTLTRNYGYAFWGSCAQNKVVFVRGKRYSILPAMSLDGILALDIIEGSYTKERFRDFILWNVVSIFFVCLIPFMYNEYIFIANYF